jgi:hypothetical protein
MRIMRWRPSNRCGIIALLLLSLSAGLWLYASGIYYRPLEPLGIAWRTQGLVFQTFSNKGAAHFVVVAEQPEFNLSFESARPSYARIARYHHGSLVDAFGFAVAWLPKQFDGGDYTVRPYAAVAVPYWFTTLLLALVVIQWFRFQPAAAILLHRLRNMRFSLRTLFLLILVVAVMIVLIGYLRQALYSYQRRNVRPTTPVTSLSVPTTGGSLIQPPPFAQRAKGHQLPSNASSLL